MKSHLLVVDDDKDHGTMLSGWLRDDGYQVTVTADARTVLPTVESSHVNLLLLDLEMPDVGGLDVIRAVRKTRSPIDLPVIVVSGHSEGETVAAALTTGANDYITKPVDFAIAQARIRAQLARSRVERRLSRDNQKLSAELRRRTQLEERLYHDLRHDPVTGLPNRTAFIDTLQTALDVTSRSLEGHIAVLFLDVDRMKQINESLGWQIGDQLLAAIANRLRAVLRKDDVLARVGADEFAVLVTAVPAGNTAVQLAERLLNEMRIPLHLNGHEYVMSISIGVALNDPAHRSTDDFLTEAASANHCAQLEGRDRWLMFDATMRERALQVVRLESDLRRAVQDHELAVVYEPIVSATTERVVGFEALVRWNHPVLGTLMPAEFIGIAEDSGLIGPIDRWVLAEAVQTVRRWQLRFGQNPPLMMTVNLSGSELMQQDLIDSVAATLATSRLIPQTLTLELTESSLVAHPEQAAVALQRLRGLGVRLALDDFGTGHSSFNYLKQFPFDTVKIDRSFVSGLLTGPKDRDIVEMISTVAHRLHMDVIAEGVEVEPQMSVLRALGCDFVQGWLFSRPQDRAAAERTITSGLPRRPARPLRPVSSIA